MRRSMLGMMLGMSAALAVGAGPEPMGAREASPEPVPPPPPMVPPPGASDPEPPQESEAPPAPPREPPPGQRGTRRERSAHGHRVDTLWRQASKKREAAKKPVDRRRVMAKAGRGA